ncbi:hypothetical protein ASPSYDRAFT_159474 [Aspergillus sydowii CBS 593.65]|uniref:Uncharacterized protein n=1 Tax=Aspergillus sydowii CBS 593.65 TaxID=1036612 RepID=A0A1L9T6R0_9EURO|nr:uncharacterized protein ASPSYDRAFT_159474 [Aspergillus sydowii CBS 593.65]OJJ54973.1 hypothetical protein ASPSYDRAFT_159474 [Aspergillus sydowii CBS 593.65]
MPITQLSKPLAQRYPWAKAPLIVSAPMRVFSGPELAVSVSHAGGLGFLGPRVKTQDTLSDLEKSTQLLRNLQPPPPVGNKVTTLPIGVGFQLWSDDIDTAVSAVEQYKPCAVWLYAPSNGQTGINTWSRRIRAVSPETQIWVQIGTVREAESLVAEGCSERPVDVIVVQGSESGGHGRAKDGMGLMALFPEVEDVLSSSSSAAGGGGAAGGRIPLFAAGGIADDRGALGAIALGADGVVMGTRFLASTEARISDGYRNEIVRARDGATSTTRTLLYNHLRGTYGWAEEYSPRTIINRSFVEEQEGKPFEELKRLHDEALTKGDEGWGVEGRLATYAGAAVGLIHGVKNAGDIVRECREGVARRFAALGDA